jgi:hypothetical protein
MLTDDIDKIYAPVIKIAKKEEEKRSFPLTDQPEYRQQIGRAKEY